MADDIEQRLLRVEQENVVLREAVCNLCRRLDEMEAETSRTQPRTKSTGKSSESTARISRPVSSSRAATSLKTEDRGGSGKRLFTVASVKTPSSRACGDEGQSTGKQPTSQTVMGAESTGNTISWAEKSGTPYLTSKGKRNGGAHSRRSGPVHSQPRTVSTGDNTVRLYLRGRSVVLYAPTGIDISEADQAMLAPQQKLQLEWVYGYRGKDCRSNIFVLPSGELLYFIAAVAIMYNPESGTQRHFTEHNDDIKCMAVHPNKKIVATGQVASHDKDMGKPHILIWDVETLETMAVIGVGDFERAISCLIFSAQDGEMLIAIDESNEHMMSVWDWKKKRKLQETRTTNDSVLGVAVPQSHGQLSVVSYGKQHVCFWTWVNDGKLQKKMGLFGKHDKPKFITVAVFSDNGDVITGDSNGTIYVWDCNEHRIRRAIKDAHAGAVLALTVAQNGLMISGGKDRKIIEWDEAFTKTGRNVEVPEIAGGVRAIVVLVSGQLILGTTGNMLVKGTFEAGLHEQMKGHCDELWGLAVSPINNHFVTAGNDRLVCVWDAMTHSTLWSTTLSDAAVCATFHSTGSVVCIGLQTGRWLVFDAVTGTYVSSGTDGSKEISAVKYSPDGSKLCVASHDNGIYIYSVDDNGRAYDKMGRCSGHSSFVTHVDWSCDSRNIQSVSGDYELLYWDADSCKQIPSASQMKDTEWSTWNCILGFPVAGIWPEGADGTDINAVDRSRDHKLVATADDFGRVNVFGWPCFHAKSYFNIAKGHSSHVTCVRFLSDNITVVSTGGKDTAIMQWNIV